METIRELDLFRKIKNKKSFAVIICSNTFLKNKEDLLQNSIEILSNKYDEVKVYIENYNSLGKISKITNTNENKIIIFNSGNEVSSLSLEEKEGITEEQIVESISTI